MTKTILLSALLLCLAQTPALSANYYNSGLEETAQPDSKVVRPADAEAEQDATEEKDDRLSYGRHVVTPLASCLDQLPEEESITIRRGSIKPYEDCQKKLLTLEKDKKTKKAKAKVRDEEAETATNYLRVSEEDEEEETAEEDTLGKMSAVKKKTNKEKSR